mmetsp:Transcript_202/g.797  ORF Transcript_202/g.797 Transcript_202/m.797 type:complete len:561 (+) Transcript_202:820-2502(+)
MAYTTGRGRGTEFGTGAARLWSSGTPSCPNKTSCKKRVKEPSPNRSAVKATRRGGVDLHSDELSPRLLQVGGEECDLVVLRPAHHLLGVLRVQRLHQHLLLRPHKPLADLPSHALAQSVQSVQPVLLDQVRDLVVPLGRGGVRPRGVRRGEHPVELAPLHDAHSVHELLLGLAGEPDNDVRGNRGHWHQLANVVHDPEVPPHVVPALHPAQDLVVPALEGNVKVLTDLWELGARLNQAPGEVARVGGREPDPVDPGTATDLAQEVREGPQPPARAVRGKAGQVPAIRVDVLAQQSDLPVPGLPEREDLVPDRVRLPALLLAPRGGHHAIRAALVAAVDDVDPRGDVRVPPRGRDVLRDVDLVHRAHLAPAQVDLVQELVDPVDVVRAHHQVHLRNAPEELLALLCCDTARHHDLQVRSLLLLPLGLLPQRGVHLDLCLLPNATCVVHQHVRVVWVSGVRVSHFFQHPSHALRVRHIHLAPEGVDVVLSFLFFVVVVGVHVVFLFFLVHHPVRAAEHRVVRTTATWKTWVCRRNRDLGHRAGGGPPQNQVTRPPAMVAHGL